MTNFLKTLMNSFSWKEIYDEAYGLGDEPEETYEEFTKKPKKKKKSRKQPVEVEGVEYESIKQAADATGINYPLLVNYTSRRRTPKVDCKRINDDE